MEYNLNNIEDAVRDYNNAIKINPKYAKAYYGRAITNFKKFNKGLSLKIDPELLKSIEKDIEMAKIYYLESNDIEGYQTANELINNIKKKYFWDNQSD